MQTEQLELSLPYEQITSVLGRTALRAKYKISSEEYYKVPFSDLSIREGFNKRIVYDNMEEVVKWIIANTKDGIVKLDPPPVVDFLQDNRVCILRGHRRYKGIQLAIESGLKVDYVICSPTPKDITELERSLDIYSSNMNQAKLNTVEQANLVHHLKNNFGKISNEEIAKRLHISRQQVDNLLLIASADDSLKNQILMNEINVTEALKFIRDAKKHSKQTDDAEMEGNKTGVSKTALPFDPNAKELAELKGIEKQQVGNNDEDDLPFVEETAEQQAVREQAEAEKELEQLLLIADEVNVKKLNKHLDKKLATAVKATAKKDFVDESTGETKPVETTTLYLNKGTVISEDIISQLVENKVATVYLFKPGCEPVAPSVITEPVAKREKDKYDSNRAEIADIQNVITLSDRIAVRVEKLDISAGDKKDLTDWCNWLRESALKSRDYIHANKKENKSR